MFEVKKFNSGEWNVKLVDRIYTKEAKIHYNWFKEEECTLMLLLSKMGAIKKTYGMMPIIISAPYLPYSRQDRMFEAGQDIAFETLIKAILGRYTDISIHTIGLHCNNYFGDKIRNFKTTLRLPEFSENYNYVFPDKNAANHFYGVNLNDSVILEKVRTSEGVSSQIIEKGASIDNYHNAYNKHRTFLICDDICDGGRTFIEAAKLLKKEYGNDIKIELMVYHGFMTYGIENLQDAGIRAVHIINPDSYEYLINKFPDESNCLSNYFVDKSSTILNSLCYKKENHV